MRELELWRDKLHLRKRGKIQDSMERFTRECVEMDVSPESVDVALTKVSLLRSFFSDKRDGD